MVSQAALFEATADMLESAFSFGSTLNVEACVGTETPLSFPLPPPPSCSLSQPLGCLQDNETRVFPETVTIKSDEVSWEWCAGQCAVRGYSVAAVEYSVACFCGSDSDVTAATALPRGDCSAMKCAANATEDCGDSFVMLAYNFTCVNDTHAGAFWFVCCRLEVSA